MVRLHPIVDDPAIIADAATRALGEPLVPIGDLDLDVLRLRRTAGGGDVVARSFGPAVPRESVMAVVKVLADLADTRFPAERCASRSPLVTIDGGTHVLLTDYVEPSPEPRPGYLLAWCAALLGRLAKRPGDGLPPGGGWHRLGTTTVAELDTALQLGASLGPAAGPLVSALSDADDGVGLPEALTHPDLVPVNAISRGEAPPVIVDWIGVGRAPRAFTLAVLLYAAGPRSATRTLERWNRSVALTGEERERLTGMMLARPIALDVWSVAYERMTMQQALGRLQRHRAHVAAVAAALGISRGRA